jgi:hypothetical protein
MPKSPAPWWQAGKVQACAMCLLGRLFLLLLFHAFRMAYRDCGCDFTSYLLAAKTLWEGGNPYEAELPFPYLYPLFFAFILLLVAFLPYWLANALWFVVCVASLVAACLVIERIASRDGETAATRPPAAAWLVATLLLFAPIQCSLLEGQVNPVVLLCAAMFYASYRRAQPGRAGAWLGAAIAIKVVPAVLLMFLIVRRQYRIVLWTFAFAALFCALPAVIAGRSLATDYQSYWNAFLWPSIGQATANSPTHFSFAGSLTWLFPTLPGTWLKILAGSIAAAGVTAVEMTSAGSRRGQAGDAWCFSAYLVGCLLVSPVVELHHFVLAAPAVFLLTVKAFFDRSWTTRGILCWNGALAACFAVLGPCDPTNLAYFAGLGVLLVLLFHAHRHRQIAQENAAETKTAISSSMEA